MVPLASHALCDSHTSKASNTKDAILQAEPPDNALARVPTACILELGVGQVTHPSLKMGNQYHHGNAPQQPQHLQGTVTGMPLSAAQVARTLLPHR